MIQCLECLESFDTNKKLSNHLSSVHKMNSEDYTIKHCHSGTRPTCRECGSPVRYVSFSFKEFCKDHARLAMSVGGKEGGSAQAWNKGLTKETDSRVLSQTGSLNSFFGRKHTDESREKISSKKRLDEMSLSDRIQLRSDEFELVTPYEEYSSRQQQYLTFKCKICGTEQQKTLYAFERGSRCFKCFPIGKSQWELQVYDYVKSLCLDAVSGDRSMLSPKEIDVYVPSKRIGIECHGLYWHSDNPQRDISKDASIKKLRLAVEQDVKLLFFFEDEWRDRQAAVKSMIMHKLGFFDRKIHARSCEVIELNTQQQKEFFDNAHLSGYVRASECIALSYKGEVVAALSLRAPRQAKHKDYKEVARYACAPGVTVPGALSRLLSRVSGSIMTYVDRRSGDGLGYVKCGFNVVGDTGIDYWYTDGVYRYDRFKFRAQEGLSEKAVAIKAGVSQIYGCGSFIMTRDIVQEKQEKTMQELTQCSKRGRIADNVTEVKDVLSFERTFDMTLEFTQKANSVVSKLKFTDKALTNLKRLFPDLVQSIHNTYWSQEHMLHVAPTILNLNNKIDLSLEELEEASTSMKRVKHVVDNELNLVELAHDSVITDVYSTSSLFISKGKVQHGTAFSIKEREPLVSRVSLIDLDWKHVRDELFPILFDLYKTHVSLHEFFYPMSKVSLSEALDDLSVAARLDSCPRACDWLKAHAKSYWQVDKGPVKAFSRDVSLYKVLAYRLGLNNSKPYVYDMGNDRIVSTRETFDINLRSVRKGFIVQRHNVSWFKPSYAAFVYKKYLSGVKDPVVWDPSIGFSARLLGFAGACERGTYIGTDPASAMFRDASLLRDKLNVVRPDLNIELHKLGSESFRPSQDSLDLVFTSPPYFDKEKYYDEPGQCWKEHDNLDVWTKNYLLPTLENAAYGLKTGAFCVININVELVDVFKVAAKIAGLEYVGELEQQIKLRSDHFIKHQNAERDRSEPFLIFKKV